MHLLALVKNIDHVCCRYRLAAYQSAFAQAGHELEFEPWPTSLLGALCLQLHLRHADAVIVQRRLMSCLQLNLVRRAARTLIFDFDDAVFLNSSNSTAGSENSVRRKGFLRMVRAADLVIAGNNYLQRHAAPYAKHVQVVPTCVDPARYELAKHQLTTTGVRLAWIGSFSTMKALQRTSELWDEIGRNCPGVILRLICDRQLKLEHLPIDFCTWSENTEVTDLAGADIGISWLPEDPWSNGKCGLKVLQYMAAGLPVVANSVGVQAEMVRHGETGFLVETPKQWCDAIAQLAADPELRRRMGRAGRQVVESHFSVTSGAARWLAALESLVKLPAIHEAAA